MSIANEKALIQAEISALKATLLEDRKLIETNFTEIIDQINPFKRIEMSIHSIVTKTLSRPTDAKPFISDLIQVCNKIQVFKF